MGETAELRQRGFTLIEMSIVLVIIGLVVGGVLVGQDLVRAAAVRAQLSQISKYNLAANTFRGKYGALPGDINQQVASQNGMVTRRVGYRGEGDSNGAIESSDTLTGGRPGAGPGECSLFWADLSAAGMIEGGFGNVAPNGTGVYGPYWAAEGSGTNIARYVPSAAIGNGSYVYVYNGGYLDGAWYGWNTDGVNYFGVDTISQIAQPLTAGSPSHGITARQAYQMDSKIDDGKPQAGKIIAKYINGYAKFVGAGQSLTVPSGQTWQLQFPTTAATTATSTTCYDNGNVAGVEQQYSTINGGSAVSCGLSFQFQ